MDLALLIGLYSGGGLIQGYIYIYTYIYIYIYKHINIYTDITNI